MFIIPSGESSNPLPAVSGDGTSGPVARRDSADEADLFQAILAGSLLSSDMTMMTSIMDHVIEDEGVAGQEGGSLGSLQAIDSPRHCLDPVSAQLEASSATDDAFGWGESPDPQATRLPDSSQQGTAAVPPDDLGSLTIRQYEGQDRVTAGGEDLNQPDLGEIAIAQTDRGPDLSWTETSAAQPPVQSGGALHPELTAEAGPDRHQVDRDNTQGASGPSTDGATPPGGSQMPEVQAWAPDFSPDAVASEPGAGRPLKLREAFGSVLETIRQSRTDSRQELTLRLDPPHLGKVQLTLNHRQGIVSAQFKVQTTEAQQLLQSNMIELRDNLTQLGIRTDDFSVAIGFGYPGSGHDQHRDGHQTMPGRSGRGSARFSARAATADHSVADSVSGRNQLDLLV